MSSGGPGLLWDLDGTLADTVADIAVTVDEMLVDTGLPPLGIPRVRGFVGDGARLLVDRCVAAAGGVPTAVHLTRFMAIYRAHPRRTSTLYPGIAELIEAVRWPQAVVTNKPAAITEALLTELGVHSRFGTVVGGDTLAVRKPDPAPLRHALALLGVDSAVMIGDGPNDVQGARAAGLPVAGVAWGIGNPAGADFIAEDVAALWDWLAARGACRYR